MPISYKTSILVVALLLLGGAIASDLEDGATSLQLGDPNAGLPDGPSGPDENETVSETTDVPLNASLARELSGGAAHLAWGSWNPTADSKGRHVEYGRRTTDLVGVFSIEMTIKLGSNETCRPSAAEWLPCL